MEIFKFLFYKILPWMLGLYILTMVMLYFKQSSFLFHPKRSAEDTGYDFHKNYQEIYVSIAGGQEQLHTVLFKAPKHARGVVFFLHGNMRSMEHWGKLSSIYNAMGYDFWVVDYRGYGKSGGKLIHEAQLHDDMERVFKEVRNRYGERIVVAGFSIGTGPATRLASEHEVEKLILLAPYYSIGQLMKERIPFAPEFFMKFHIKTCDWLPEVQAPVLIVHGDKDKVIPYHHGVQLSKWLKEGDRFIGIEGQGHHKMMLNPKVIEAIEQFIYKDIGKS